MNRSNKISLLLAFALIINACGLKWEPVFHEQAAAGQFGTVVIADLHEALTFARIGDNAQKRVIGITRYQSGWVKGVDLSIALNRHKMDHVWLGPIHPVPCNRSLY